MAKRKAKRAYRPAIEGGEKGVVVSAQRAKWKAAHEHVNPAMIQLARFVWMRQPFPWDDRHKLHAGVLGACMRAGLLWPEQGKGGGVTLRAADYRKL